MAHEIIKPTFSRSDTRGVLTEVLNGGHWESLLNGSMNPGAVMGNHYHQQTVVFFYLTSGAATVKTVHVETGVRDEFRLNAEEGVLLHPNESHAIRFDEPSGFIMLKSVQYDPQNPDTFHYPVD
jgi:quercetin dioxygenase-like cupin family protein